MRRLILGPEAEGLFTLFGIAFFLIGIALFGIGLLGEYVGRIYQQVRQRPRYLVEAMLEQATRARSEQRGSDAGDMTRAVVFAYHNVGVRCLSVLLAQGVDVRAGGDAPRQPEREHLVRQRRAQLARAARHPGASRRRTQRRRRSSRASARCGPISCSRSTTATCCGADCSRCRARGAFNMHGSLLPKYRGRVPVNWAVIHGETRDRRDAAPHGRPSPTPATSSTSRRCRSCRRHRRRSVRQGHRGGRDGAGRARCRGCSPAPRALRAAGSRAGQLLRRAQARRRPHRLDAGRAARSTTWCAPWRRPIPARSTQLGGQAAAAAAHHADRRRRAGAARRRSSSKATACCAAAATAACCACWQRSSATRRSTRGQFLATVRPDRLPMHYLRRAP